MSLDAEKHSSLGKNIKTFGIVAGLLLLAEYSRGLFMFGSGDSLLDDPVKARRGRGKTS
ncbi:MAG TPA: hypothetical protein VN711_02715 [Candidatus Saccharimonadales bacterium]|nr:hypothetical protein [Candidatus Saccharimonadales bacterium]